MARRLPPLYAEGEIVEALLGVPGVALDIADEDMLAVQRSHWVDRATDLEDVARLAAVLDLAPEPWQRLGEFRAWLHALRNAMLLEGAVTRGALARFTREYATGFQRAQHVQVLPPLDVFEEEPSPVRPAIVEHPPARRDARAPAVGGIEPLHRFTVEQKGLDPVPAALLLAGLPEGPEHVPVVANLTTRQALVFRGSLAPGQRLWIVPDDAGGLSARLERDDVTDRVVSIAALEPGQPWDEAAVQSPAQPLTLARGANELWFLPVAHFDLDGLDRFLLALADLDLHEGRWDETWFDHALFFLDPAMSLHVAWTEAEPAAFELRLPAGTLGHAPGEEAAARAARDTLAASLSTSVDRVRGAGIRSTVTLRAFEEVQRQAEHLVARAPLVRREVGPTGADAVPDAGGAFGVTSFDDSTYR